MRGSESISPSNADLFHCAEGGETTSIITGFEIYGFSQTHTDDGGNRPKKSKHIILSGLICLAYAINSYIMPADKRPPCRQVIIPGSTVQVCEIIYTHTLNAATFPRCAQTWYFSDTALSVTVVKGEKKGEKKRVERAQRKQ